MSRIASSKWVSDLKKKIKNLHKMIMKVLNPNKSIVMFILLASTEKPLKTQLEKSLVDLVQL